MWDYTDKVLDHFKNPRNVGKIENPDGVGHVGALACGDALTLMFKLNSEGRIDDVKFQTFGCASAIAASSALTEMIKGLTPDEALKISNKEIADYLGGLPDQKMHCSVMGQEALEAAVHNYRTGETSSFTESEDPVICHCFDVHESEIVRVINDNKLTTVEQVTNFSKAGGACGNCIGDIQKILDRIIAENSPPAAVAERPMTQLQKIRKIEEIVDNEIRPALQRDGGDIELIDVRGDDVIVAMRGACIGCASASITLSTLVEAKLREFVSPALRVLAED
ncbi:MAG: Fe-S cluster assembly protein NifU [Lentisphaerae bacterium]|nr:Fe-S cluster assembly protein NifU [Lentisphaerota bacterium]